MIFRALHVSMSFLRIPFDEDLENKLISIRTISGKARDFEETKATLKYVSLASNISNGRNLIAQSEALRLQHENAKDYLCSQFGLSEGHLDAMNSNWTKELHRWKSKMHQFRNRSCNPIAWISRFSSKNRCRKGKLNLKGQSLHFSLDRAGKDVSREPILLSGWSTFDGKVTYKAILVDLFPLTDFPITCRVIIIPIKCGVVLPKMQKF